ncbi:hypothetical protein [Ponticoccus alexandrii]|uniref:Uncharacterized protein n=1 Tax=Ponticoccus alexandrii TaxID=1943633 RepID=A0ABX7F934_9RHOB|nr:hypothetical protein [Ponticoccus alexandrii]ETA53994.1 hypothetical protein P279_00255 [Rhodobacteraceae bacterium PD-2]QRF66361.1 hypothetical protein GQA70_08595 [Ponticoccus alexandrii]
MTLPAIRRNSPPARDGFDAAQALAAQRLWQSVLLHAWLCSFRSPPILPDAEYRRAVDWFGSADFYTVCRLAGFEPSSVLPIWREKHAAFVAAGAPSYYLRRKGAEFLP